MTEQELIGRLEAATGPDRELDCRISALLKPGRRATLLTYSTGPSSEQTSWVVELSDRSTHFHPERYTSSIDTALTLVPETANCHGYELSIPCVDAFISRNDVKSGHWLVTATHKTSPAIALCIAALKAHTAPGPARSKEKP